MKVGFYQFSPEFGNPEANALRIEKAVRGSDADLLIVPELATSGYLFLSQDEVAKLAEPVPGPTTERLTALARSESCHIVTGLPERAGDKYYNSAVLIGPKGILGTYRKAHLFFEEQLYFTPGDSGFKVFSIDGVKIGVLVCFDHLFPESARALALEGAQILCYPSNLVLPTYGQLTTRVRAIENQIFTILSNRCGVDNRGKRTLSFTGSSQIVSPKGEVLTSASPSEEVVKVVEIDPAAALDKSVTSRNDLFRDRRPELYKKLTV